MLLWLIKHYKRYQNKTSHSNDNTNFPQIAEGMQKQKHVAMWINLANTRLSEIDQTQQDKYRVIALTWGRYNGQIHGRKIEERDQEQGGVRWRGVGLGITAERVQCVPVGSETVSGSVAMSRNTVSIRHTTGSCSRNDHHGQFLIIYVLPEA